jgi:hypothetical protein
MQPDGRFFAIELYDDAALRHLVASASGGSTLGSPLLPNMPPSGHAMYAASYRTRAGEVWFGDARPGVTRIVLENARSRRFIAAAALPPKRFPSSFRFWVVAVPHTHATTIYAYDAHGRLVEHRALFATREMSLR